LAEGGGRERHTKKTNLYILGMDKVIKSHARDQFHDIFSREKGRGGAHPEVAGKQRQSVP
jgi:hypothetical protein